MIRGTKKARASASPLRRNLSAAQVPPTSTIGVAVVMVADCVDGGIEKSRGSLVPRPLGVPPTPLGYRDDQSEGLIARVNSPLRRRDCRAGATSAARAALRQLHASIGRAVHLPRGQKLRVDRQRLLDI